MNKVITWILVICPFFVFGQGSSDTPLSKRLAGQLQEISAQQRVSLSFENKLWCYLKFDEVPSSADQAILEQENVELFQYQPDLKWFASLPVKIDPSALETAGIQRIWIKPNHRKIDQRILNDQLPSYAATENGVEAIITVASVIELSNFKNVIKALGVSVQSTFDPLGILYVQGSAADLIEASELAFVIYIELPEPPAELEIEDEMSTTRGTFINGYYNLDGVTGDGITIAVNEGGIVDSLYDPDFKNRIDRSLESGNTSGHKTGVSWRMASAGNINPVHRGQAWGAELMSGGINFSNAAQNDVNIVNNSFGYGCIPSAGPNYNAGSAVNDFLVYNNDRFMITYSCGNIGNTSCASYGAGAGWGSITGLVKSAKNIFAVGSMNTNDQLTGFSSIGPAMDGRILPDITAAGPGGTSHASPNLAGVNALLTETYRNQNNNQWPNSGLIKGIILNTSDDVNNPGPDFKTGFGRINARRAKEVIANDQLISDTISNNGVNNHSITVPTGVSQLKVSIYWTDRESTSGNYGKTLVNDLNLRVQTPSSSWVKPWILNTFPDPDSLDLPAIHGTDTLNNVELVTIDNPASGNYTAEVTGSLLPLGSELYHVIYSFVYDSITVTYPKGGEGLVPGETRRIRWDAFDSNNTFDIDFSSDSGSTWQSVVTGLASDIRSYTWPIPSSISGKCLVRVSDGNQADTSSSTFTIAEVPMNLHLVWRCADSAIFAWDSIPDALGYRVYKLGNKYMDTVAFTADPLYTLHGLSSTEGEWVTVQTILPDSGTGRRAIALNIPPEDFNCIGIDLAMTELISPGSALFPSCLIGDSLNLKVKLQNTGTSNLTNLPVSFQINGGAVQMDTMFTTLNSAYQTLFTDSGSVALQSGVNNLRVWCHYPGDSNALNDTIETTLTSYGSSSATLPYVQNFDGFINCSTAWGCASVSCNLSQGWYNLSNANGTDSIDWRTHSGATGSGGTGPSGDHTSGNGKYLYLEGSGNGGSGCQYKEAQLHSPCFDLDGSNNPEISYWFHAYGGAIGELHMDVLANGQWHLDVADPVSGQQGNQWIQRSASLSAFEGEQVIIRFRGMTGPGWTADLAIDDINLTSMPLAAIETAYDTFCLGQDVQLLNETTYGSSYTWSIIQSTYSYIAGNASSFSPIISPSDTGWYDVQLVATNTYGSDTVLMNDLFYVGDFNAPTLTSDATNNTYCHEDSATFTASGIGSSYTFFMNGNQVQSGSGDTWTSHFLTQGDSVWVENHINPTCSEISPGIVIQVQPDLNDLALLTDEPDLEICENDTVNFTVEKGLSNYRYMVGTITTQDGPDSLFQSTTLQDGDVVYCVVTDSIGCSGYTDSLTWTVIPLPATPTVLEYGEDSLQASVVAPSYQWWKDTQLLNETTQIIAAQGSGTYVVEVIEEGCSSLASEGLAFTMLGISSPVSDGLRIYPNPTDDALHVFMERSAYDELSLFDQTGRLIWKRTLATGLNRYRLDDLAAGLYTISAHGRAGSRNFKLIVN